jgi:DnaJ-class molecular chaperone
VTCRRCGGTGTVSIGLVFGVSMYDATGRITKKCPECQGLGQHTPWTEADEIGAETIYETEAEKK